MKTTIRVDMNKAMAAAEAIADNRRIARDLEQTYSNEWETREFDYDEEDEMDELLSSIEYQLNSAGINTDEYIIEQE